MKLSTIYKLLLEEIDHYSFFISDKGEMIKIKGEHYDWVEQHLKDFGYDSVRGIYKDHTGMVEVVLDRGWIRGRIDANWDDEQMSFEYNKKHVSKKAIAKAIKLIVQVSKQTDKLSVIYVDNGSDVDRRKKHDMRSAISVLRKNG